MSGLLHLVEAATVLTQLGPSSLRPSTAYQVASLPTSTPSAKAAVFHAATISDDDETLVNACTTMAKLRENHLRALYAAASDPNFASTTSAPTSSEAAASTNLKSPMTSLFHTPAQSDMGEPSIVAREMFPMRLHALLADPTVRDVISWLPHGRSFVVLRPDIFATHVLPRYFAPEGSNSLNAKFLNAVPADGTSGVILSQMKGVHKYPSFTRKLNRWGFRQISRGPDSGAFCHDLFQRDDPELCRGMVCQKSRKLKNSDDLMSVSSGSTMGTANKSIASNEKRRFSSTVTVSTAGVASSNKSSLPLKKRKSGHHTTTTNTDSFMMNGIPSMISHRFQKMSSSSSITESDLTSENGSVGSNNNNTNTNNKNSEFEFKSSSGGASNTAQIAETLARESLAHHFHEQRRAFALASLMENSRLAMEAAGMSSDHASVLDAASSARDPLQSSQRVTYYYTSQTESVGGEQSMPSAVGESIIHSTSGCAPIAEDTAVACTAEVPTTSFSVADAAKMALYKAYLEALTGSSP